MNAKFKMGLVGAALIAGLTGCTQIKPNQIGIRVYKHGNDKGNIQLLGNGWQYYTPGTDIVVLSGTVKSVVWTADEREGSKGDDSFSVSANGGTQIKLNVSIMYYLERDKATKLYGKFWVDQKQLEETYLHQYVRNAFSMVISEYTVAQFTGKEKEKIFKEIQARVSEQLEPYGIHITQLALIGKPIYSRKIQDAMDQKVIMEQKVQASALKLQISENLYKSNQKDAESSRDAAIKRAEGVEKTIQKFDSALDKSKNPQAILTLMEIQRWDGKTPLSMSDKTLPFINLPNHK